LTGRPAKPAGRPTNFQDRLAIRQAFWR
jgi:hypothetical protein